MKKIFSKIENRNKTTIKHYTCTFVTTDGKIHSYSKYRYIDENAIKCSGPEYIMIDIISNGYLKDDKDIMYPVSNIISISWKCDDEIDDIIQENYNVFYDRNPRNISS